MSMQVIEHIEVGSGGAASIEFTSIPATYTDLMVLICARSDKATNDEALVFDLNATGTNETIRLLRGTGSTALSASGSYFTTGYIPAANATANTFGNASLYIPNYTSSNAKSLSADGVMENNTTAAIQQIQAMLWNNTSAITSIELSCDDSNFVQYSSATLYGITAGSDGTTTVS